MNELLAGRMGGCDQPRGHWAWIPCGLAEGGGSDLIGRTLTPIGTVRRHHSGRWLAANHLDPLVNGLGHYATRRAAQRAVEAWAWAKVARGSVL